MYLFVMKHQCLTKIYFRHRSFGLPYYIDLFLRLRLQTVFRPKSTLNRYKFDLGSFRST